MTSNHHAAQRVGIAGLGTIGRALARALDAGALPGLTLGAVSVRDSMKANQWMQQTLSRPVDCVDFESDRRRP